MLEQNVTPERTKEFKDWNQGARKIMYWLSISVTDTMIGHIQDADSPATAWKNLVKMFETNTKAKKLQLKSELNNIKRNNISINDYSLNIKSIVEALGSIKVTIDDDDLVGACLDGLGDQYKQFRISINTRENIPCFTDFISMLILEEKNMGRDTSSSQSKNSSEQAFYSNFGRGRGRGRGQGGGQFGQNQSYDS